MESTNQDINRNEKPKIYRTWDDGYIARAMTPQDAKIVQAWYCGMGKTSEFDLDVCLSVYPPGGGFYIGEKDGEVVASCIRIPWGDVFYGSYYYVAEKHRRAGYGTRLRDEVAREYVGDNILCVDAVIGKVAETNKKFGYVSSFKTGRFHGEAKCIDTKYSGKIVNAQDIPFEDIIAYDDKHFVRPNVPVRHAYMKKLVTSGGGGFAAVDDSGKVTGFGFIHSCIQEREHIVGPLYADSSDIAEAILCKLCSTVEGQNITFNLWYPNQDAVGMIKKLGWENVFDVQRMHVNGDPNEFKPTVYAITSIDVCGF